MNERTSELQKEIAVRKKAEEALQKLNEDLETAIDRVTATKQEIEHFAFITSHHLKEPVRKISTFASMLTQSLADNLDEDQRENLNFMIEGANKMAQMVKGLKLYLKATIDEVEYFVYIGGVKSETHYYSESYTSDIKIVGGEIISLTLPVTLVLGPIEGAALVAEMMDGTIDYTVEGTFHAIEVDGSAADFFLPLYVTGVVPSSLVGQ